MPKELFVNYLASKVSVDDRALNLRVWNQLKETLHARCNSKTPLRVLEIGGGIGTMLTRMLTDNLLPECEYTLLDLEELNTKAAPTYLADWADQSDFDFRHYKSDTYHISTKTRTVILRIVCANVFEFIAKHKDPWDLVIGHAVLDLFDPQRAITRLKAATSPKGLMYFTINYDGHTVFEPQIDPSFERQLLALYNQSMDERQVDGEVSGDSQTGRHLFEHLRAQGVEILAAGSSDWVVFAGADGYPHREADFLHFLIDTIHNEMGAHPQINTTHLSNWVRERKKQIANRDLVCIVHQLDFLGKVAPIESSS